MKNLNSRLFPLMAAAALCMSAAEAQASTGSAPADKPAEQPKEKAPGVGDLAKKLIREGKGNKEVLEAVKAAFPESKTSMSSINWYRNHLRGLGEDVRTAREISQDGKPTKAERDAAKAKAKEEKKAAKQAERDAKAAEKKAAKEKAKADAKATKEKAKADASTTSPNETDASETAGMMA